MNRAWRHGDVLADKYVVEAELGNGGMGVVLAARHVKLGHRVAIKIMRAELASDPKVVERFEREAKTTIRIRNEHVARVHDVGTLDDGVPFIVMEYLEGTDLARLVRSGHVMPVDAAVDYVVQACEALAEAHALGIVHRDIKPANLFLTVGCDGTSYLKVLDFGISKVLRTSEAIDLTQTTSSTVIGTVSYMAPEQLRGSADIDARTDVWALGAVLYEVFAGRAPFWAKEFAHACARIVMEEAPRLDAIAPRVPPGLAAVVARCLEKEPVRRFATVAELAAALVPFGSAAAAASAARASRLSRGTARGPEASMNAPTETFHATTPTAAPVARSSHPTARRLPSVRVVAGVAVVAGLAIGGGFAALTGARSTPVGVPVDAASPRTPVATGAEKSDAGNAPRAAPNDAPLPTTSATRLAPAPPPSASPPVPRPRPARDAGASNAAPHQHPAPTPSSDLDSFNTPGLP